MALIGLKANAAIYIVGDAPFGGWDPAAGVEMTPQGDGTYTYTTTISGTVYFVFADGLDSDWGIFNSSYRIGPTNGNQTVTAGSWLATQKVNADHGAYLFRGSGDTYAIFFDEINHRFMIDGYVSPQPSFTTYTVAGNYAEIFGETWNPALTENDMTLDPSDGLYKLVKKGIYVPTGFRLEYKVVADHDWSNSWGKTPDGNNQDYYFTESGTYNLLFLFNAATGDVSMDATLIGGEPVEMIYTVVGPENVFGSNWDPTDVNNDMIKGNNGLFKWTKRGVELVDNFGFKVVGNHSWENEWPMGYENNWIVNVAEEGVYTIVITFDPEADDSNRITCTLTKTGEMGPEPVYGDLNGDGAVNISDINLLINNILDDGENLDYDLNGDGSVNISDVALLIDCILSDHTPTTRTPSVTLERKGSELWCNITGEGNIYIDDENYGPAPVDHLVATQTDKAQTGSFIVYAIARGKEMSEIVDVDWELEAAEAPQQVTPTPSAELVRTGAELWCNITGEGDIYVDDVNFGPAPISFLITSQTDRHQSGSYTVHAITPDMEPSTPITVEWELEAKPVNGFGFADMLNTPDNTTVSFTRDAIVLWQRRYYLFAMDDTGFGLIYGDTGQTYNQGDVIPAGFGGNKMLYMGEPEIQNPTGFQPAVDNVNVSPLVISVDDIGHPLWSHYVVVKNVTIGDQEDSYGVRTITDADGATGAIYSGTFFVDLPEDLSKKYDIYGIINAYKSVYQILPTQFVPAE